VKWHGFYLFQIYTVLQKSEKLYKLTCFDGWRPWPPSITWHVVINTVYVDSWFILHSKALPKVDVTCQHVQTRRCYSSCHYHRHFAYSHIVKGQWIICVHWKDLYVWLLSYWWLWLSCWNVNTLHWIRQLTATPQLTTTWHWWIVQQRRAASEKKRQSTMFDLCDKCERIYMTLRMNSCEYCSDFFCPPCNPHLDASFCCTHHDENIIFCCVKCKRQYIDQYQVTHTRGCRIYTRSHSTSD